MKKLICFILALTVVFCFASCKEKGETEDGGVDVSYYADLGQIPETEFSLKSNADDITKKLKEKYEAENATEEDFYDVYENDDTSTIVTSKFNYIYNTESKKLLYIVDFGTAYGFDNGTDSEAIKNSLSAYGNSPKERSLTDNEKRLFAGSDSCTCLEYEFDKNTVVFAFEDNFLFATAIYTNTK